MRKYLNLIGGEWVPAAAGTVFETRNPADARELTAQYAGSGKSDTAAAIEAARKAFPAWSGLTAVARGRFLSKASQVLESRKQETAEFLTREEGKTIVESQGEVQRAVDIFRFFGGLSYTLGGQTIPHDLPHNLLYTVRQPLGVVALITPWNFPIAIPAWKLAPALAVGNTVVMKPASQAPGCALELAKALQDAGLPKGVFNVVTGEGGAAGGELCVHPAIMAMSFTGSYEIGRKIHRQVSERLVRTQLEMGAKNPTIVLADADLDLAVNLIVKAGFGLTGQACTATSRVIVERPIAAALTEKLVARANALRVASGMLPSTEMGPAVSLSQLESNLAHVAQAQAEGARLLCGGARLTGEPYVHGHFMAPTLFDQVTPTMRIANEEVFGPVIAILTVDSFEEAIAVANGTDTGLSATLVSRDLKKAMLYAERIEAGVVKINQISTGLALQAPFGGVKHSSTDSFKEQGAGAIEFYSRLKTVYLDYSS